MKKFKKITIAILACLVSKFACANTYPYFKLEAGAASLGTNAWTYSSYSGSSSKSTKLVFGGGAGYSFNKMLRFDVMFGYGGKHSFTYVPSSSTVTISSSSRAMTGMGMVYLDLPISKMIVPFVGAGGGAMYDAMKYSAYNSSTLASYAVKGNKLVATTQIAAGTKIAISDYSFFDISVRQLKTKSTKLTLSSSSSDTMRFGYNKTRQVMLSYIYML